MSKIVIGFAGHINSGKDEAAKYLKHEFGFDHYKVAYPLQDVVAIVSGIYNQDLSHRLYFEDREWKESYPLMKDNEGNVLTPRDLMKYIGGKLVREQLNKSVWANLLRNKLNISDESLVISDVRYPEELDVILNTIGWDGYLVYIVNPLAKELADTSHSSERFQDYLKTKADYKIFNDPRKNSLSRFQSSLHDLTQDILNIDDDTISVLE